LITPSIRNKLISLTIEAKILIFFLFLVIISIASGLFYSLDLFYKDKSAYVFEASLSRSEQIAKSIIQYVKFQLSDAETFSKMVEDDQFEVLQTIIEKKREIYQFALFEKDESGKFNLIKEISSFQIINSPVEIRNYLSSQNDLESIDMDELKKNGFKFTLHMNYTQLPFLTLVVPKYFRNQYLVLKFSAGPISAMINSKSTKLLNLITDLDGNPIPSTGSNSSFRDASKKVNKMQINQGTFDTEIDNHKFLVGYQKIPNLRLNVLTLMNKEVAFEATQTLIKKSIAIGFLILSISLGLGLIFAHSITKPIDLLMEGTKKIANGEFGTLVDITSTDEIGEFANSFNIMSEQILRYTEEIQEKVRMEKELAVAHLVQNSFFPNSNLQFGDVEIAGFYQSASECGGDWWGAHEIEGKKIILIGDATGHGVPSALVTATANCCAQLLKDLTVNRPEILHNPAQILSIMNRVIYNLSGKILMTFFVGILDDKEGYLIYSNASHNFPLICRFSENEATKENITVLMEANGKRLGHALDSAYENSQISFKKGDTLLLFTDGILESENASGKQYGERRFLKSFLKSAKLSANEIILKIQQEAYDYYENVPPNDDITLVVVKKA
jgi:sigma-B regulation protein RsbU (phosphoserine phosphatase)